MNKTSSTISNLQTEIDSFDGSQKHITDEYVKLIEKYSKDNFARYNKLLQFAENIHFSRFKTRLEQYYAIKRVLDLSPDILDFDSFLSIEQFIFENKIEYTFAVLPIANWQSSSRIPIDVIKPALIDMLRKKFPTLTGSRFDKLISLIVKKILPMDLTQTPNVQLNNDYFSYDSVCNDVKLWLENEENLNFFNCDFEKLNTLLDLNMIVANVVKYKKAYDLYKLIKPETKKLAKQNLETFYKNTVLLIKDLSFYQQVIDQTHKYINIDNFFSDMKKLEIKENKSMVLQTLRATHSNIIYDNRNELVAHVQSFTACNTIGITSWCLTNYESDWNRYVGKENYFIIYWKFSNNPQHTEVYGICINKTNMRIVTCQDRNNCNASNVWGSSNVPVAINQYLEYLNISNGLIKNNLHNTFENINKFFMM